METPGVDRNRKLEWLTSGEGADALRRDRGTGWIAGCHATMATLPGEPLYKVCGYQCLEAPIATAAGRVSVPLVRMSKALP